MRKALCIFALLLLSPTFALAQTDAPTGLQVTYALSYGLDVCGDGEFGASVRKAAMDVLDYCHVPLDAQTAFKQEAAKIDADSRQKIAAYMQAHGGYPDKLEGDKKTCKEKETDPKYITNKALFAQYAKGEVTLDKVLPDACKLMEPFTGTP